MRRQTGSLKIHIDELQTDTEVTTRQTEGGTGPMPMLGHSPQIPFLRESSVSAARTPVRASTGSGPVSGGVEFNLNKAGRPQIEPVPQRFEGHETQTAVVLGGSPKSLYNKLNGYAREAAFSHS